MIELPKYARNIKNMEAGFLLNLYNHPAAGIKQFFEVEPQGTARIWDGDVVGEYQDLVTVGGRQVLVDQYQIGTIADFRSKRQEDFCGRGIGKSMYNLALKCAWWGVVLPYAEMALWGTRRPMAVRFVLTGNNLDTAKQLIQYIRNFIAVHPLFAAEIDPASDSKLFLKLKNGTEYHVRAASDAARGLNPFSFWSERFGRTIVGRTIVVCDEFAYVVDQTFWNEVVEPYLSLGWSGFWAATTPNGKENAAYSCSLDKDFVVRRFPSKLNIYRDLNELVRIKRRLLESGYPEVYAEEYDGIPQDQKWRLFSELLMQRCYELFPGGVLSNDEPLLWTDGYIAEHAAELKARCGPLFGGADPNKGKEERGDAADAAAFSIREIVSQNPYKIVTRYSTVWGDPESTKPWEREQISSGDYIDRIRWLNHVLGLRFITIDGNPGKALMEALKFSKDGIPGVRNIDWIDTDSPKKSKEADDLTETYMKDGKIGIPPDTDLQRAYSRYGTTEKRTGIKRTDRIKAEIYATWAAVMQGRGAWAPGTVAETGRTTIGASMPDRAGRPIERAMTSVGTRTMTSVGRYGKTTQ